MSLLRPSQIDPAGATIGDAIVFDGSAWAPGAVSGGGGGLPIVNVMDHGAVADGTTNDATAINNAIAALPTTGGIVYFPAGDYAIASTINVGNGTSTAVSTRQGIYLQGVAGPLVTSMSASGVSPTGYGGVRLKWTGSAGGTMLAVLGPLVGWGLKNLILDGQSSAGNGIVVTSAQGGDSSNVAVHHVTTACIQVTAVANFSGLTTNAMHNFWRNVFLFVMNAGPSTQPRGLIFDGTSTANACYEQWDNVSLVIGPMATGNTAYGVIFKTCDNIRIRGLHFAHVGLAGGTSTCLYYNYTGAVTNQPADNLIEAVDFGSGYTNVAQNNGTPAAGAAANRVVAISSTNSSGVPPTSPGLTNLKWGYTAANP